ncbi:MAG TPA: hypothetical protein EYP85_02950 [Armatimonadetes bacterium]|nr:hypothetical protein [Armatimonadota bacterium]
MEKKYLILVSHTHWDREWYSTFQEFRRRLVHMADKLLHILDTDPEYRCFTFDGQTVVLEDYLEIRPENEERLRQQVQNGRLLVGPWYILPDEFLVSGEAFVRNLMLGHQIAARFGRVMKAGYLPDPFGQIAQLPQILRGFGIDSALFMRGLGEEAEGAHNEFLWEALDGTSVLAVHLRTGYCNAANLGYRGMGDGGEVDCDLALQRVRQQMEALAPHAATRYLLLCNGCDHLEPQPELPQIIAYLNEHLEEAEVVHSTYEDYIARVRAENPTLHTLRGEFHSGKYHPLLPGVFSTRIYLKQANERSQTLLEKWAEPLSALAWALGGTYERAFLWRAWKFVQQNHPHDSICGCSIDQVHREMMPRFEQAQQIGELLTQESLDYLGRGIHTALPEGESKALQTARALIVFNPLGQARSEVVTVPLRQPCPLGEKAKQVVVRDEQGRPLPAQIGQQRLSECISGIPGDRLTYEAEVTFLASEVPACGYKTFYLTFEEPIPATTLLWATERSLENALVRVEVNPDGSLRVTDKRTGATYDPCNLFEDVEDAGDEYNYSPAYNSRRVTSYGLPARVSLVENGPARATLEISQTLSLPASLTPDHLSRSEETVECPVTVRVSLTPDSPRIDFVTTVTNRAKDHRLRVLFPTGFLTEEVQVETAFGVVTRRIQLPEGKGWVEKPVGTKAQQSFVDLHNGQYGLAVLNRGLPEYEALQTPTGTVLALTLLRCVGWLSRDDHPARPYHVGPKLPTPDAQCLGTYTFHYALWPHVGSWQEAEVWRQAHAHQVPLRGILTDLHPGEQPKTRSFLCLAPNALVLSALKKAEGRDTLIARVYNTTPEAVEGTLTTTLPVNSARRVNLNEEPLLEGELTLHEGTITFPVRGFEIVTVELEVLR